MKTKKDKYRELKKIKSPVFLIVRDIKEAKGRTFERSRLRILEPDGMCSYVILDPAYCSIQEESESCFVNPDTRKIKTTVDKMKEYDRSIGLEIMKVVKL